VTSHNPDIHGSLLENLFDGVLVIRFDGSVIIANAAVCRMFGLEPDAVVGQRFGEIFLHSEGFDEFTQIVLDAVAGQSGIERRIASVRIGDTSRSLSVTISYLTTEATGETERVAVIAVVADITELRELRDTELRMAKVIEEQFAELQNAYREVEDSNAVLSLMMRRVQAARGLAAVFVVGLFLAIGVWYVQPLDLLSASGDAQGVHAAAGADLDILQTMIVEPEPFHSTLSLRGHLAPGRVMKVVSPMESHVSAVHARQGQHVAQGDLLVELDTSQLAAAHRRSQVEHIRTLDRLAEIEDWENSAEMARARRTVRRAKIDLDEAERAVGQTAFLLQEGLIPAMEHDEARQRHENRKLDFEAARLELETVQAKSNDEVWQIARLEVENASDQLREHEEKLSLAAVRAPIAGIITAERGPADKPLAKGRPVVSGELLLSIADFERVSVVTRIDEVDVRKIRPAQRAWITGPGFPDLRIEGTVAHVSSRAEGLQQQNTPQFDIVVDLDRLAQNIRDRLRIGMSAHVTIIVYNRPAALLIPIAAVEQADGQAWVRIVAPTTKTVERRAVEIGLTTLDSIEVVTGLSAGDEVVLPPPPSWPDSE